MNFTSNASDTGALWNAIGRKPVAESKKRMEDDGWQSIDEDPKKIKMQYRKKRATLLATLYVADGKVGMVQIDRNEG